MASPTTSQDLGTLLTDLAGVRSEQVATLFRGQETTYRELDERANRVANGLRTITPANQVRVALLDKNSDAFFEVLFGAARSGAVLAPVNWRLAPSEVAYILNDAAAEVLFVGEEFSPLIAQISSQLRSVRRVVALSGSHPEWEPYPAWRDRHAETHPELPIRSQDVALQLYTSGTTGRPKGVQLTHHNVVAALQTAHEWYPCTAADVSLVCMPQFHIAGSIVGLIGLHAGARTVIVREAVPAEILRMIAAERVTQVFLVPALMLFMLQTHGSAEVDLSCLRQITYGSSPITLDLLLQTIDGFKCRLGQVYGMTETGTPVTFLSPEDHDPARTPRLRSCGTPLSYVEMRVVDQDDAELPPGQVGEIVVRSDMVMKGYWNLPEATATTLRNGWLHTGDAGYFDADGYLYIHDRVKDMIISGGENIYPAEVESVLAGHACVADVAVIGIPDERWGEAVKAIVVLTPGEGAGESDLIEYCRERIAHYKAPKSVEFADSLPRNASGKLLKRVLRAPYWEGRGREVN
jgi:acyl-CoA synthetase (AMP-forming)/AMP-acid ligase II